MAQHVFKDMTRVDERNRGGLERVEDANVGLNGGITVDVDPRVRKVFLASVEVQLQGHGAELTLCENKT